jgi:hypothetical protein
VYTAIGSDLFFSSSSFERGELDLVAEKADRGRKGRNVYHRLLRRRSLQVLFGGKSCQDGFNVFLIPSSYPANGVWEKGIRISDSDSGFRIQD